VYEGTVYVGAQDMQLHAAAASDGSERWTFLTAGKVESVPTAAGETVYFGSGDSRIYAVDARDGSMLWYYSTGDAIYSQPLVKGNVVYAASMGSLLAALMADSGELLWEYYSDTPLRFTPILSAGQLYLAPASDPSLYLLNAATGSVKGKVDLGEWPACQPVAANGLLYVAQRDSTVLALRIGP
jgi:outer membrane protein assembly factor BamB